MFGRANAVFPGGVNSPVRYYPPYPRYMRRGEGPYLQDVDGRKYADYVLGYGPLILGHSEGGVVNALHRVARNGMIFGAPAPDEVALAEMIGKYCPSLERMRFVASGSEATMHALRLAIHHTGRKKIVKMEGGYHGTHTLNYRSDIVDEVGFNSINELERKLSGKEYAAVIIEPALGNAGFIPPEKDYLQSVRELCNRYGSLLVCDEVITGFRTRFGLYSEAAGVEPDIVTLGKIIGGGMPLALYGGRDDVMRDVKPAGSFPQAGTYAAHPVSVAAGLKTLDILRRKDYGYLRHLSEIAAEKLLSSGLCVTSDTGMVSLFFTRGKVTDYRDVRAIDHSLFPKLFRLALDEGIFIPPSQEETIFISFSHTQKMVSDNFSFIAEMAENIYRSRRDRSLINS